ncbi:lysozyme inhibitor LprI family protein [Bosea sp. AS-1]|uniref:lysozyme inhibitor LprI family protein n=1 Tax=Bosea sp. AS-1 TaxID=2015316 RepID=UPI000B7875D0|nr:lysozyme inhibitor LprI family protein [Bosea sp. AS-1]
MLRGLRFLPVLAVLVSPAAADDAYKRCIDGSDGTNPAWGACGGEWVAREDARLNATWKRLYEASGPNTKKDLLEEQRAWNAFKEKSCRFYDNGDFGREGQVLHFPACRAEVIARRTEALKRYEIGP